MSSLQHLNGTAFAHMMCAGHQRLKANVQFVNALNIFPVPDGDTGTNMELSMAAGIARLAAQVEWPLHAAANTFAAGLLMGARGNSGVILSQLFRGFIKASQHDDELNVRTFSAALTDGVQIAYRAVAKPVEGTILTVAAAAAAAGAQEAKQQPDVIAWLETVYRAACSALEKTPDQLPVLKQAGVVDSGGQGLVYIFEGFLAYLKGEDKFVSSSNGAVVSPVPVDFAATHVVHHGEYGYCTEVLIRVPDANRAEKQLRKKLAALGDSMLVVGVDDLVKVHVHSLNPGRVLEEALSYGPLVKIKIDNMTEQYADLQPSTDAQNVVLPTRPNVSGIVKPVAVVAVAVGDGLKSVFESLDVDVVVSGGQTMNPSTEDLIAAIQSVASESVLLLPNNKNIILAAEQAKEVLGDHVNVVPTTNISQGIAAMMAYRPDRRSADNAEKMWEAAADVIAGQVVRAVRNSVFQEREIREGQFLGFLNQSLVSVSEQRLDVLVELVGRMKTDTSELVTLFYGSDVPELELASFEAQVMTKYGVEVEATYGGQPVYDYIFTVE